jgi:PEP-CTERM motif
MKRVVVIALVALSLPMAAWASSIDIGNRGGTLTGTSAGFMGTSTLTSFGGILGSNLGTLTFSTGAFTSGGTSAGGVLAPGGTFVIMGCGCNGVPSGTIFSGMFTGPVQWIELTAADGSHNYTLTGAISGTWTATGATVIGATTQITVNMGKVFMDGGKVDISSGNTNIVVPEPGTLGLLGTGLLGVAGLVRRKLTS